tara:strand:- start:689 stop:871 length:183 start_codon:yes stop_codon:yes gene_type:complete
MTKDDLLEVAAVVTAKNIALEEKIEEMEESHAFQLKNLQERIELYKRILKRHEENDEEDE